MKFKFVWGLLLFLFFLATSAQAQTVIVGPNSTLQWDVVAVDATIFTYNLTVDAVAPVSLNGVTCGPSVPLVVGTQTCKIFLSPQVPSGSHTLTMTTQSGAILSASSLPFSYITLIIPVPTRLRISHNWYGIGTHREYV